MIERHRLRHQILRSTPCPYTLRRPRVLLDDTIARHPLRSTRSSCHELFQNHTHDSTTSATRGNDVCRQFAACKNYMSSLAV